MPGSLARPLAGLAVAVTAALETATLALTAGVGSMGEAVIYAAYAVLQVVAGAVVVWRFPRHRVGWLLVVAALANAVCADGLLAYGRRASLHGWVLGAPAELVGLSFWIVAAVGLVLLFLWFPDGRTPRLGRWVIAACAVGSAVGWPGWALSPGLGSQFVRHTNPYAVDATVTGVLFGAGVGLVLGALLVSIASLVVRFCRAEGIERLQLTWMVFAAAIVAVVLSASPFLWTRWPPIQLLASLALALLPLATSVAILRYRLYDVDLVVSRTVAYVGLTGILAATYAGVVVLVGSVLSSPAAAAVGALVVAVAFRPVRDRIQDVVDRRFRRARHESRRVMGDYVDSLRRGAASIDEIESRLRTAVGDPTCVLAFDPGSRPWYDVGGEPLADRHVPGVPGVTGVLVPGGSEGLVTTRAATRGRLAAVVVHSPASTGLVAEALDAGRLAFEIAGLQIDLRRQLSELDASRSRMVAVADEERRRIARDLHDGAQQRLVTIGLTLRHVQHTLHGSSPEAHRDLDAAVGELGRAIDELRGLAGGLRPSSLDQGLRPALAELAARTPTPVRLEVTDERFAPELEAAAYFIAAEGLTNAVKHAGARQIALAVGHQADRLVVAVHDDGMGGANRRRGTGLLGLADRAESHGGTLEVESPPGGGTRLKATLPCV